MKRFYCIGLVLLSLTGCISVGSESTHKLALNEFKVLPRISYDSKTGEGWIYFDVLLTDEYQQQNDEPRYSANVSGGDALIVISGSKKYLFDADAEVDGILGGYVTIEDPSNIIIQYRRAGNVVSSLKINNNNGVIPTIASDATAFDRDTLNASIQLDFQLPLPYELPTYTSAGVTSNVKRCYSSESGLIEPGTFSILDEFTGFGRRSIGSTVDSTSQNPTIDAGFVADSLSPDLVRGYFEYCDSELKARFASSGSSASDLDRAFAKFEQQGEPEISFSISITSSPIEMRVHKSALER